MEKSKLKNLAIIGLLLLNLATLGFIYLNAPEKKHPPMMDEMGPRKMIVEKLHFDENQKKEFAKLIDLHHGIIQKLDEKSRKAKIELYSLLGEKNVDVAAKGVLINLINQNQKEIEEAHFKHFEDIKKLCNQNQLSYYSDLTKKLGSIFTEKKQPRESRKPREPRP